MSLFGGKSNHKKNVKLMLDLPLRLYEKTVRPNPLLPTVHFERADSRCRDLLFCLSTVQLACSSKMKNPDAIRNECAQAALTSRPKVNLASVIVFSISFFLETRTANYVN